MIQFLTKLKLGIKKVYQFIKKYPVVVLSATTTAFGLIIWALIRVRITTLLENNEEEENVFVNEIATAGAKKKVKKLEKELKTETREAKRRSMDKKINSLRNRYNLGVLVLSVLLLPCFLEAKKSDLKHIENVIILHHKDIHKLEIGQIYKPDLIFYAVPENMMGQIDDDLRKYDLILKHDANLAQYTKELEVYRKEFENLKPKYDRLRRKRRAMIGGIAGGVSGAFVTGLIIGLFLGLR
jgi:hypothetical protein